MAAFVHQILVLATLLELRLFFLANLNETTDHKLALE
jgi:hypothetical protein